LSISAGCGECFTFSTGPKISTVLLTKVGHEQEREAWYLLGIDGGGVRYSSSKI
jgi:hypothetical protein